MTSRDPHPSATQPSPTQETLVTQMAHLARLELTAEEVHTFAGQLGGILEYVAKLQEVDVSGTAPLVHPLELQTPLREDSARPSPTDTHGRPKVLESAPEVLHDGYKVPPIL